MKKNKMLAGALALALSIGAVLPTFTSYAVGGGGGSSSGGSGTGTGVPIHQYENNKFKAGTTKVTVHKLMYDQSKADVQIDNKRGKALTDEDIKAKGLEKYNKAQFGDVGFTVYKIKNTIDKDTIETVKEKAKDSKNLEVYNSYDKKTVDENGEVSFDLFYGKNTENDALSNEEGWYVIKETVHNEQTVTSPAEDIIFRLPLNDEYKAETKEQGYLKDVHIYPKNKTKQMKVKIKKYFNQELEDKKHLFKGVKFKLYKGNPGEGTEVNKESYITDEKGEVIIDNLPVGKYYFVEEALPDTLTDEEKQDGKDKAYKSYYAQNDKHNRLVFDVGQSEIKDDGYFLEVTNYTKPESNKELDRKDKEMPTENNKKPLGNRDYEINSLAPFKMSLTIPYDIKDSNVKSPDNKTKEKGYKTLFIKDTPHQALSLKKLEGQETQRRPYDLEVKIGDTKLVEGTDFTVEDGDPNVPNDFKLNFIVNGSVSETVANNPGKQIDVTYKLRINKNAEKLVKKVIDNKMEFVFNNKPEGDDEKEEHEDYITTYGARFQKVKIKTVTDPSKEGLKDATFVVFKKDGDKISYIGKDPELKEGEEDTRETIWVDDIKEAKEFVSGENGYFEVNGLKEGNYFIKETKAPKGYIKGGSEIEFTVGEDTHSEEATTVDKTITNRPEGEIPLTGSLVLLGVTAIGVGSVVASKKLKKEEK